MVPAATVPPALMALMQPVVLKKPADILQGLCFRPCSMASQRFTASTAASSEAMSSGRPLTGCCGRCCRWCSASGVPGPAADEAETDATPDEGP